MEEDASSAFKELYDEIDRLYYLPVCDADIEDLKKITDKDSGNPLESADILKDEDIDELIEYSKKFVEKAKNEINTLEVKRFEEHAVQCRRSEKKSNKKLGTPPRWVSAHKEAACTNLTTAIRIIKRVPAVRMLKDTSTNVNLSKKNQLNNQTPPNQLKKVRNIGTNVNFIHQRTIKQQNSVTPGLTVNMTKTPPIIKKPVTPQTSGKIYRFYCSQLSPAQLWEQQHPELAYESSERSIFPRRIKKSDLVARQVEQLIVSEEKELKVVHFSEGLTHDPNPDVHPISEQAEKPPGDPVQESPETKTELPKAQNITKHVIPAICIKGDWKINLQVQETSRINIVDKKSDNDQSASPNNLKYIEIRHGMPYAESPVESLPKHRKKLNTPCDTAEHDEDPEATKIAYKPKSVRKVMETSQDPCVNRYLQPFINLKKPDHSSLPNLCVDSTDVDSSSDESIDGIAFESDSSEGNSADGIQSLNLLHGSTKIHKATKLPVSEQSINNVYRVPRLVSPTKSVQLQVPSPPCILRSPSKTPSPVTEVQIASPSCKFPSPSKTPSPVLKVADVDDYAVPSEVDAPCSSKFLENLRIWKSAIQVQSENMKLGNQLSENLDTLKQNMEVIAEETQNITKITRNCEKNLRQIEGLKERYETNLGRVSPAGSVRQPNPVTQLSGAGGPGCSCFGCQPMMDTLDYGSIVEPNYDHKSFQRVVLEQNPKYSKTIKKICEDGRNQTFKKSGVSQIGVERAAQTFLESCSRSMSRNGSGENSVPELDSYRSHSPGSVGSYHSSISNGSNSSGDTHTNHRWFAVEGGAKAVYQDSSTSEEAYLDMSASRKHSQSTVGSSFSGKFVTIDLRKTSKSLSDEGEVLSQGEVK